MIIHNAFSSKKQSGFSLIEVLIAFAIIMIGVIGFAKTQALALSNTNISNTRSNAALQVASLAAAMHANQAYWAAGLAPASLTATGIVISNVSLNGNTTNCLTQTCTSIQLAAFDLKSWGRVIRQMFQNGQGRVVCSTVVTAPITCTISISWQEKNMALNTAVIGSALTTTQT